MGNIINRLSKQKRDKSKQKLEEVEDSPQNSLTMPMLPPSPILETHDSLGEPKEEGDNTIFELQMQMHKIRDSWH